MNIVFCLGSMGKGGAERVIANLSNYLADKDNLVSIITTVSGTSVYTLNKKIKHYSLENNLKKNNVILKNIIRIKKLKSILKKISPDIIISFLPEPSYRVLLLKKSIKVPVIVSVRNDPKVEYNSKLSKICMNYTYPKADGFVFQTEEAKKYFNERIQKKSVIIPNPISDEFVDENFEYNPESNKIVNIGRLNKQKNQELLIKAFKEISIKYPQYKLYIYGEGDLRIHLEQVIKDLCLEQKVFLPGETSDVKEKLKQSKIFVLTSDYEGMPNTLMEAMATGLPCISTNCPCGGPKFLISNGENGILIPTNNKDALVKSLEDLINNKEKCIKLAKNAKKICNTLNPQKINSTWEEYIKKIVNNYNI